MWSVLIFLLVAVYIYSHLQKDLRKKEHKIILFLVLLLMVIGLYLINTMGNK